MKPNLPLSSGSFLLRILKTSLCGRDPCIFFQELPGFRTHLRRRGARGEVKVHLPGGTLLPLSLPSDPTCARGAAGPGVQAGLWLPRPPARGHCGRKWGVCGIRSSSPPVLAAGRFFGISSESRGCDQRRRSPRFPAWPSGPRLARVTGTPGLGVPPRVPAGRAHPDVALSGASTPRSSLVPAAEWRVNGERTGGGPPLFRVYRGDPMSFCVTPLVDFQTLSQPPLPGGPSR